MFTLYIVMLSNMFHNITPYVVTLCNILHNITLCYVLKRGEVILERIMSCDVIQQVAYGHTLYCDVKQHFHNITPYVVTLCNILHNITLCYVLKRGEVILERIMSCHGIQLVAYGHTI